MRELSFDVVTWLGAANDDSPSASTLASLRIRAGASGTPLTEVEDIIARTVRDYVNVPALPVAQWLLVNWWRLRFEPRPEQPWRGWRQAHSMAAVGSDYAWPDLEISSDGEFVHLELNAERSADVSAIRYLRDLSVDVPASDFEAAVDRFIDQVEGRLAASSAQERNDLAALRSELYGERTESGEATRCRWQALAGINPGDASPEWLDTAAAVTKEAGPGSGEEIMAMLPPAVDKWSACRARTARPSDASARAPDERNPCWAPLGETAHAPHDV